MANCNNHPSHLLPGAFHGSHSPSSGTGRSQDLSCTRFPCSLPELHISFVFDTLRFSVCIHIRVRLLYQSTSRLVSLNKLINGRPSCHIDIPSRLLVQHIVLSSISLL